MYRARLGLCGFLWIGASSFGCSSDPAAVVPQGGEGVAAPASGVESPAGAAPVAPAASPAASSGSASAAPAAPGADGIVPTEVALEPEPAPAAGASNSAASDTPSEGSESAEDAEEAPVDDAPARVPVDPATLPEVTLHLAGDSTVMTYEPSSAQEGWGQELGQFFIDKLAIDNQAIGGASVQTFHDSSRWRNITSRTVAGDFVMAQFGANDSGSVAGRHVEPAAYRDLFRQMADEVEAKGATFILVTPSAMQEWRAGKAGNQRLGPYVDVLHELAQQENLLIDDLNARGLEFLDSIGQTAAEQIYINGDKAHFTKTGATQMATFVAAELARIGSPLASYLK